jgi:hypothetical protein
LVWHTLSPRLPIGFYICSGSDPAQVFKTPLKIYGIVEIGSVLLNLVICVRIKLYKQKEVSAAPSSQSCVRKSLFLQDVESQSLSSLATNIANTFLVLLSAVHKATINNIDPKNINQYPYSIYIYFVFFISPSSLCIFSVLMYYCRQGPMRRAISHEIREVYYKVKESYFE